MTSLPKFNVSGSRGSNGRNGADGRGSSYGVGGDGGDATPAQAGQPGGTIDLYMSSSDSNTANFKIWGQTKPWDTNPQVVDANYKIISDGFIELMANGGRGGDGGNGGDGGRGANGARGHDATEWSDGTSGSNGYRGGDGGNGTSGANGGAGGMVQLKMQEADMHLFMLVATPQCSGGQGGTRGRNGAGGSGGSGGAGGSSYSWTTTSARTVADSYYDSYSESWKTNYRTEYDTIYHSRPGGYSGSNGSSGSSGSAVLRNGSNGDNGDFKYVVQHQSGWVTYKGMYDLTLQSYEWCETTPDGILEPEDELLIKSVLVKNPGKMPTPVVQAIVLSIRGNTWIQSRNSSLLVTRSIPIGGTSQWSSDTFVCRLAQHQVTQAGEPFSAQTTLDLMAVMTVVNRQFMNFSLPKTLTLSYPLQVSPVSSLNVLSPSTTSKIFWRILNISTKDLGSASLGLRVIGTTFSWARGDITPNQVSYRKVSSTTANDFTSKVEHDVHLIAAKNSVIIEGRVKVSRDIPAGSIAHFSLSLQLGRIRNPQQAQVIHLRDFSVAVAHHYEKTPGSQLLLLTNRLTSRTEIAAWKQLAKNLNTAIDIWDLSLYGYFDIDAVAEDFRNKTIIVLDNVFNLSQSLDAATAASSCGLQYLSKEQFQNASQKYGIHFYVVGTKPLAYFSNTIPTPASSNYEACRNAKDLMKKQPRIGSEIDSSIVFELPIPGALLFKTTPARANKRAKRLQRQLNNKFPDRHYCIEYGLYNEQQQDKSVGLMRVRQTWQANTGIMLAFECHESTLHDPNFVLGGENIFALLCSMPFEQKMIHLMELLQTEHGPGIFTQSSSGLHPVWRATLADLHEELALVMNGSWNFGLRLDDVIKMLPKFQQFASIASDSAAVEIDSVRGALLIEMLASLKVQIDVARPWLNRLLPFRRTNCVHNAATELWKRSVEQFFWIPVKAKKGFFSSLSNRLRLRKRKPAAVKTVNPQVVLPIKTCYYASLAELKGAFVIAKKTDRAIKNLRVYYELVVNPCRAMTRQNSTMRGNGAFIYTTQEFSNLEQKLKQVERLRVQLRVEHDRQVRDFLVVDEDEDIGGGGGTPAEAQIDKVQISPLLETETVVDVPLELKPEVDEVVDVPSELKPEVDEVVDVPSSTLVPVMDPEESNVPSDSATAIDATQGTENADHEAQLPFTSLSKADLTSEVAGEETIIPVTGNENDESTPPKEIADEALFEGEDPALVLG